MPRYDPLPYQWPFTHGWNATTAQSTVPPSRCRICNYGPETPQNLGYHYLDTHDMTVEQAAAAVAGLPMLKTVDEDELPV